MAHGHLGAAAGGGIAADHAGRAAADEVWDIEFAGVVGDGPGGARVAEAVGVDARDARGPAEASQQLFEPGSAACEEKLSHCGFGLSKRLRAIAITPSALLPRRVRCFPTTE